MIKDIHRDVSSGYVALLALIVATAVAVFALVRGVQAESVVQIVAASVALTVISVGFAGFFIVNPNQALVLQLFGSYVGTAKRPGLRYANPFYTKKRVSLRVDPCG